MPYLSAEDRRAASRRHDHRRRRAVQTQVTDFDLREIEVMTRAEVAVKLGISESDVELDEARGLAKLAKHRAAFAEYLRP